MRSNLSALLKVTERLIHTLTLAEAVMAIVRSEPASQSTTESDGFIESVRRAVVSTADTQGFFYAGTVVSLYGALEQFVEGLVEDAARGIAGSCPGYAELPEELVRQHTALSTGVLTLMVDNRYHGELQTRDVASGLHRALTEEMPIRLNTQVFSQHTANFRWPVIQNIFQRIGLPVGPVLQSDILITSMGEHFPDESNLVFVVDDLAQRRNEVSHGWESEILSFEIMRAYIAVIAAFAEGLFDVVATGVVQHLVKHSGVELGRPDRVFQKSVAGYEALPEALTVGQVVAIVSAGRIRCARILNLQQEGVDTSEAAAGTSTGVLLSKGLGERNRLFVLPVSGSDWV